MKVPISDDMGILVKTWVQDVSGDTDDPNSHFAQSILSKIDRAEASGYSEYAIITEMEGEALLGIMKDRLTGRAQELMMPLGYKTPPTPRTTYEEGSYRGVNPVIGLLQ